MITMNIKYLDSIKAQKGEPSSTRQRVTYATYQTGRIPSLSLALFKFSSLSNIDSNLGPPVSQPALDPEPRWDPSLPSCQVWPLPAHWKLDRYLCLSWQTFPWIWSHVPAQSATDDSRVHWQVQALDSCHAPEMQHITQNCYKFMKMLPG
jgi:hypothetical protein